MKPAQEEEADPGRSEHTLESLQRAAGNSAVQSLLTPADGRLEQPTDAGTPLPASLRRRAERRLEADLSGVRLHTGAAGAEYADRLGAEAVTVGRDVFLRDGAAGQTTREERTLMHELTHAAQAQGSAEPALAVSRTDAPAEREAAQVAMGGLDGARVATSEAAAAGVAHRQVPVDEEEIQAGVEAPAGQTATAQPAQEPAGEAATGAIQPAASPLGALFEVSVTGRIRTALDAMTAEPPDPALAHREIVVAYESAGALAPSYRETDVALFERLHRLKNYLAFVLAQLGPMVGTTSTADDVRQALRDALGGATGTAGRLH
ncbi:MAG TPA: DUF4157 domain-containing protein [Candidatus Limnocylindria bacterium]|nr:DUF4157 domain-containing protein [Candidatus Limnocylindria bacterium]